MSSGGQRPPANRMTLQLFKARLGGATKGFKLLKKKRDALKTKFQALLKDIVDTKLAVGQGLKDAAFSLAKAHWANSGDDITSTVVERARRPSVLCKLVAENVAGVSIPVFKLNHDPTKDTGVQTLGIGHGGAVISACREMYFKAITQLVKLASLQTAFNTLDEEIKMTSRRVNALEYVLIPRIENLIQYITQEMDEEAREEFFRVKKVVEKKKAKLEKEKLLAAKEAEHAAALKAAAAAAAAGGASAAGASAPAAKSSSAGKAGKNAAKAAAKSAVPESTEAIDAPSVFDKEKDPDIIF